jgi:hypothetical protein
MPKTLFASQHGFFVNHRRKSPAQGKQKTIAVYSIAPTGDSNHE